MPERALTAAEREMWRDHVREERRDERVRKLLDDSPNGPHAELTLELSILRRRALRLARAVAAIDSFNGADLAVIEQLGKDIMAAERHFAMRAS